MAALVRADVPGAFDALIRNGLASELTAAIGSDSPLTLFRYQVELRFKQMT